ncbi:MAG: DUF481 domain-containing protein [Thermodesulfobacteriota bacterium]|nr:DUF481 domain-containing protein [Thermodesulfobacteriota bacterium]
MKCLRALIIVSTVALLLPGIVYAETEKWSDVAELSYVNSGGNTEVETLAGKNTLKYEFTEDTTGTWKASMLYGKTDDAKTAEQYATEGRIEYKLTDRVFSFVNGGWLKDEFSGINKRYYGGVGSGYKILTGEEHFLNIEAGVNYVKEEYIDGSDRDYMESRLFAGYVYQFSDKDKFSQTVEYLYDFDESENYYVISETSIISAMNDSLSLKVSYFLKYDNMPVPTSLEKTDTILTVAMLVNF